MTAGTVLNTYTPQLKNLIINGNMDFWQRGTSANASATGNYLADRFKTFASSAFTVAVSQSSDVPTLSQSNFQSLFSLKFTNGTGAAGGASDYILPSYLMEGYDFQNIIGKKFRFQFWCKSSVTGTFAVQFLNNGGGRSYVATFTISSVNTWQKTILDIPADTTLTGTFNSSTGMTISLSLMTGSGSVTSNTNQWISGNISGASGQTNWGATTGATFQLAQVCLFPIAASSGTDFPFVRAGRSIGQELQMCQRYCEILGEASGGILATGVTDSTTTVQLQLVYQTTKRAAPNSVTFTTASNYSLRSGGSVGAPSGISVSSSSGTKFARITASSSGLTAGNAGYLESANASGTIIVDAEL